MARSYGPSGVGRGGNCIEVRPIYHECGSLLLLPSFAMLTRTLTLALAPLFGTVPQDAAASDTIARPARPVTDIALSERTSEEATAALRASLIKGLKTLDPALARSAFGAGTALRVVRPTLLDSHHNTSGSSSTRRRLISSVTNPTAMGRSVSGSARTSYISVASPSTFSQ